MPLDKGKLQKLYSTLQQGGYTQSYAEFEKGFTGNDNYPNRKKVYDLLTEHGADIGSSYEEFMKKMYTPAASSPALSYSQQRTQAPAPKPTPRPKPKGGGMTAAQKAAFIRNAQNIVHSSAAGLQHVENQMDYANGNRGLKVRPVHLGQNSKVVRRHANGTVAKPRPVFDVAPEQQPGDTYLTESGNEFTSRSEADTEQNTIDQYRYDQSETGQLNNAYAEAARLDQLLEQRGKELDSENEGKWWRDMPRGGGGAVSTMNANDNNGRMNDTEYLNLLAARKKVDEQIRDLKAARDEKTGTFLGGLWRGFRDYAFDLSNWDNGYRDLLTTSAMLRAKTGAAQTPREKASERMMMEDTYKAGEAAQKAEEALGNGYRWARITAQALPYGLQLMAGNAIGMTGGIARAGEGMGVKLARKIAIKEGANNMIRNFGRSVLKNTGVMLGDLGAAAALSTTVQAAQTGADIGKRYAGDVVYDPKTDDYKLEGGKSLGRSIYEGVANSTIENYTEMLGEHMHLGKFASSALTKVGLGRVSNWFTKVGKTDFMQGVNKYMKMAGFNGYPQEVMEEEVGIPLHAVFDGGNKMSDLLDGRQQLDIVGGMLFSMAGMGGASMAMQGGHKAAMAVQYHQDQHKLDNADKVASFRLTADKWAPIKDEIDGTTNEDFGKVMKDVLSNDELSDQEKQAVWDYAQRLIIMRGHNMGQEAATRNGMTDKETNAANESYTQGYNTTDATAMNDAKNRLAAAQAKFDEAMKKEGVETWEGHPDMQDIQHRHHDADEVLNMKWHDGSLVYEEGDPIRKLAQDVVNAQQEYEGMMQRVRDEIDDEVQQTGAIYDSRTNDKGVIQSATLEAQNPDGTDKKVYITSGNIVMTDDGKSVDRQKSDMSVVVVDDEGKVQMISPEDIFSLDTPIDGAQAKQQAIDAIQQSRAQEAADKINGKVNLAAGSTYTLTDNTGQQIEATIVADSQTGAVQNPDGTVNVSMNGKVVPMDVNTLQQMVDNTNMQRAAQGDEEDTTGDAAAMQQPTEPGNTEQTDDEGGAVTPEGAAVPTYPGSVVAPDVQAPHEWQVDDTFTIDNGGMPVRGQVTGIDADGVEIYTESPINGKKMQVISPEELQSMTTEINGETVQGQEDAAAMQQPTQPVDGEQTGDNGVNGSNGVNGEQPQGQAEPQQTEGQQPQRAIDRIPSQQVDDGKGNVRTVHNWEQAEPGDTYDALTEIYHGNADRVKKGVQNRIGAIDKQIKSTQKQMDAIDNSDDFDAVAAQGEQYDQLQKQKEALEQQRKYWQSVQGVPQQRKLDEDKRTEEEKAAAKAAQEKAEAEAAEKARQEREQVNGVPDVVNDIPADARKRGFRNVNGMVVNRQGETQGVTGRESNVKFSSTDTAKGHIKVIDADQLQPSHVSGQRNPSFFIDEAQPKDRTDTVSSMAAAKIASNLNPEEITGDGSAYQFSAPTVNSRGEVIQGNNRSDALKLMYSTPAFKPAQDAYKQYISDHAEEFGFTPEDVAKIQQMQHPVMVNELGVDDDEAIRLGQMKASDNESGGIERIDPVTTSQKLGAKVGSYANILLSSPDEDASLSDVLMQNGAKTVHWLSSNGIISNTAAQSAFDRKGNLTPEARMDLLNILKQSLFQGGVSDLPTMFDKMPAKAQKAILNTFMRDFDSAESERILPDIQKAIEAWYGCAMSNEAFAKAPNYKSAKAAMHDWTLQTNLLDDNMPSDKFSNFAMELACRLQGCSMRETQQSLNDFFDLVQGKSQGDLFGGTTMGEQADRQEAIKRIFNIEYNPINNKNNGKTGSNAVADNGSQSGEGRQGSPTDGKGRERAESGSGSADGTGGTESHDEEGIDKGAAAMQQHTQPSDDSSHSNNSSHSIGATSSSEKKETERQGVNTEPSEKQKEAGNYKKGHIKVDGFDITIENPKGSTRSGKDASGKAWSVPMHYDYGYIKGTEGVDGDHIDVYLSDNPTKGNVYVVDQVNQKTGKFDEHKVMYGFPSKEAAVEAYKTQYEKGWKVGPVTEVSREDFKKWVESSKRKTKPFSEYKSVKEAAAMQQPTQQSGSLALERRGTEHEALPTLKEPAVYKNNLAGGDAHVNIEGNPKSGYVVRYYDNKQEADINYPLAIGTEYMTAEQLADHLQKGDFTVAEQPTEPSTPTGTNGVNGPHGVNGTDDSTLNGIQENGSKVEGITDGEPSADELSQLSDVLDRTNKVVREGILSGNVKDEAWKSYFHAKNAFGKAARRLPVKRLSELVDGKRHEDWYDRLSDVSKDVLRDVSKRNSSMADNDRAFDEVKAAQPPIDPVDPPKRISAMDFAGKDKSGNQAYNGVVYHDGGYVIGTDGHVLFAQHTSYPKELEGKTTDKKGNVTGNGYPKWRSVIPDMDSSEELGIDTSALHRFVCGVLKRDKKAMIAVRDRAGHISIYKAKDLDMFLRAAGSCNADVRLVSSEPLLDYDVDNYEFVFSNDKGTGLIMSYGADDIRHMKALYTFDGAKTDGSKTQKNVDEVLDEVEQRKRSGIPEAESKRKQFDPSVRKDLERFVGEAKGKGITIDWEHSEPENAYIPMKIAGKASFVGVTEQDSDTPMTFPSDRPIAIYDIAEGGDIPDATKIDKFEAYVKEYNSSKSLTEGSDDYASMDDQYPYVSFKSVDAAAKFNDWLNAEGRHSDGSNVDMADSLLDEVAARNDEPTTAAETEEGGVLYREVDDEEAARLDNEPTVKVYRAMQEHDGKLYPPMSGRVKTQVETKKGTMRTKWVWRSPIEIGKWEQSEEHPEMANEDGTFTLDKGNGSTINAAYNPYIHTSRTPINDQFSSAWNRPELVTVEVEVPASELTSGYHAEKAKDATGEVEWKSGPVGREMAAQGKPRMVILSRWDKPVRIVPVDEVADEYAVRLAGTGIKVPFNTVPPALRDALVARGVEISEPEKGNAGQASRPSYEEWLRGNQRQREGNGTYSDEELSLMNDPVAKWLGKSNRTKAQQKAFANRERKSMETAVRELADRLHLDNVNIVMDASALEGRKARAKGFYDRNTGQITIVIPNHRDVDDVMQTLLHEGVAHYGLRKMFGEHFDTFLDNVYAAADDDVRKRITDLALRKYNGDFRVATEEYLASLAERTDFEHIPETFWQKIKDFFLDMLHAIGFEGFARTGVTLSDNELRYILWRSYENLKEPGRYRSILGEAEDVAKQAELKVGNYGETGSAAQQRPTEPSTTEQQEEREQNPSTAAMYGSARNSDYAAANDGVREPEAWGKRDMLSKAEQVSHGIDPDLLFRDTIEDDDNTARETYNRMADEARSRLREAWQDSMINVRNLQQAVLEQRGEKLEDYEDAYNAENRSHGKSRAESEYFTDNLYKPLLKAVNAVAKAAKVSVGDVTEYMMAKHGLERNVVFASRDAQKAYDKAQQKAQEEYDALMNAAQAESDPKKKDALEKRAQKVKFPDYNDLYLHFRQRDYSGLTALTGQSDAQDAEVEAQRIVTDMESKAAVNGSAQNGLIDELWKATNAATEWTLRKAYESGMMSRDNYDYVRSMFNNYIPLRGWEEDTAGDLYDYVGSGDKGTAFSPTLHKAKGRRSQADNPIAYIGSMAVSAIVQGNKNKVKQTFMRFAENHPTNLVTVSEMWYRNFGTDTAPDWREDVPYIPEDATADEIAAIVKQHEDDMEQLEAQGMATKQRGRLHLGVPVKKGQALEHHVEVMVNGKKYVLYINGNPRAAQALNGTRMRRSSERSFESSKIATIGRKLSERYTSLSPSFTVSNMFRDLTMAAISTAIKESPAYALRFRLNVARLGGPARMFPLMRWYRKAVAEQLPTGQMSGIKRYFYEFMTQGAETGFTSLKEIDTYKDDMQKMYKHMNQSMANPKRLLRGLSEGLEYTNRCIEDMTRFATYMTSRQSGRSVRESVSDAKTITLNFNRKGSGELGNSTYRNLQIFVNPAIQSLQNVASMAMDHPVKFSLYTGMVALIGAAQVFATQLLWSMFGGGDGDDDNWNAVDEYWKLPSWQRRNNLVMWIPGTKKFAMIPLAQEFRVFHGFGETLTTTLQGKSDESPALELMSQTADLLPLDFAGNNGNMLVNLAPTVVQPLLQVRFNTDFTGRPLYKDTGFNKYEPSFQKAYVGTPSWLVKSSEFLNDLTGGDDHKQGWWERTNIGQYANNPAVVDHLLKGYLGGMYSFFTQTVGAMLTAASGKLPDVQEVPVANRVVTAVRETEQSGKQKLPDWYYDLSEENDRHQNEFSGYKKDYMKGDADGQKKFNALIKSKDFAKWQEVNTFIGAVQQIRTAMNYTKDPNEKAELQKNLDEVLGELKKMKDE